MRVSSLSSEPMNRRRLLQIAVCLLAVTTLALTILPVASAQSVTLPIDTLQMPPGFRIEVFAKVPNARQMALGEKTLFVGSMHLGKVHAIELGPDHAAGRLHVVASGLKLPVGVAFRGGSLYVSAVDRILRLDDIEKRLSNPPPLAVVRADLPQETHHGWKFIAFGPDGWLYIPVGAPCNICAPNPDRYAAILRMKADGTALETYARGVRNSVGFDWHPTTQSLWFTDNGRDLMGDDVPPDELNHAPQAGMHFGYPYCHGGQVPDPDFAAARRCAEFTAPAQNLGAHVASLGMRFYTGTQFPAEYRNQVFIAEHGSWNRSKKVGYRVTLVKLQAGRAVSYTPFVSGWLQGETAWGRPADILVLPDGSLLVSDDHAGAIYRIRYQQNPPDQQRNSLPPRH